MAVKNLGHILAQSENYARYAHYDKFMTEKEVDHLKWVRGLEALFLKNIERADVQLDPTKCGLGQFLYGEEGKRLCAENPKLCGLIEAIKAPHRALHESGRHIHEVWKRSDGLRTVTRRVRGRRPGQAWNRRPPRHSPPLRPNCWS
jgi:methyl-accepting chemotaxis protein